MSVAPAVAAPAAAPAAPAPSGATGTGPSNPTPARPIAGGAEVHVPSSERAEAVPPKRREPVVEKKAEPIDPKAPPKTQPKADAKAPPKPTVEAKPDWWKKVELGKDSEPLEFGSADEATNHFRRLDAQSRAWQKKQAQIEAKERALEQAGGDPIKAARVLNPDFDPDAYAIQRVNELYQLEQMDPKDRQIQEHQKKLADYERQETERTTAETKRVEQEAQKANRSRWEKKLGDAVREVAEAEGFAENVDYKFGAILPQVAGVLFHARQQNPEGDPALELTPQEVAREVLKMRRLDFDTALAKAPHERVWPHASKSLDTLPDTQLMSALGQKLVARIVKAHLEATNPSRAAAASFTDPAPPEDNPNARKLTPEEDRRELLGMGSRPPPRMGFR